MVKTSITIPDDIYREAKKLSDNFSLLVSEAIKEYLRMKKVGKAKASFGKWGKRDMASIEIVKDLRKEGHRKYADRNG